MVLVCLKEDEEYKIQTSGRISRIKAGLYAIAFNQPIDETIKIEKK